MEASVAAPPAQGAPPASQPPAGGQGQQQGSSTGSGDASGFWGRFPNVPEGQRELLEPHLKTIQGYTTQLEQRQAPYQALMQAVPPEQVEGLLGFLQGYSNDPMNTWLGLMDTLRDEGHITNPAMNADQLRQMLTAQQEQQQSPQGEQLPPWAQEMQQKLNAYEQAEQQRQAEAEQATQEQLLGQAHQGMKQTLAAAGIPEGSISDEMLNAYIIAHKGDVGQATQALTGFRENVLKGFVTDNGSGSKPPTIAGATPEGPKEGLRQKSGDGFREASIAASQALAQTNAAAAQG
jgi:hypothetical protein